MQTDDYQTIIIDMSTNIYFRLDAVLLDFHTPYSLLVVHYITLHCIVLLYISYITLHYITSLWQLSIASNKCSCLSISNKKTETLRLYLIDSLPIPQVESCCDLGILIDDKLSFSAHILPVAKKASSKSFLMHRCFQSKNPSLLSSAFTSYVCPILESLPCLVSLFCQRY